MSLNRHLKDYVTVLLGSALSRTLFFISSLLVARLFGKGIYGQFSLFYVAFNLVPLLPQAFDTTFIRYAKNLEPGETKEEYLRINLMIKIALFLLLLVVGLVAFCLNPGAALSGETTGSLYLFGALGGGAVCFCYSLSASFQENGKFLQCSLVELSYGALIPAVMGGMWLSGLLLGLPSILFVYILAAVGAGTISLIVLLKKTGPIHKFRREQCRSFLSLGRWIFLTSIVMYTFPRLDILTLSRYVSFEDIGLYSAASSMVMVVALFSRSLNKVVLPKAMQEAIYSQAALKAFKKEVFFSSAPILILSLGLFALAGPVIRFLYGSAYLPSADIFRVLIIGNVASMLYRPYSFIFYAFAEAKCRFWLEVSKAATASVLLLVLIPPMGLFGAATAISISMTTNAILSYIILNRKIASRFGEQGEEQILAGRAV